MAGSDRIATTDEKALDENFEIRSSLAEAYAFVQGQQAARAFTSLTYEALADRQIERIEGQGTLVRPNELERIDRLENQLLTIVAHLKSLPAEWFIPRDNELDVNTDRNPADQ